MTPIDLSTLSDSELEALVAEHVAGWKFQAASAARRKLGAKGYLTYPGGGEIVIWDNGHLGGDVKHYLTDANACLALLEKREWSCEKSRSYQVGIGGNSFDVYHRSGWQDTFQRAAVYALLCSVPGLAKEDGK